jgi:flagellar biosynthesis protein FlhB
MAEDSGERTEQATDARREDFRKRGQVAHTRELGSGLILLVAAMGVYFLGRFFFTNLFELFNYTMGPELVTTIRTGEYTKAMAFAGGKLVLLVLPVMGLAVFLGVAASVAQVGILQVEDALSPKWEKLNPVDGIKRIVSFRGFVEFLKSLLKLIGTGVVL